MDDKLVLKLESGSLDWTQDELNKLPAQWREQIEADIIEEAEHQALMSK